VVVQSITRACGLGSRPIKRKEGKKKKKKGLQSAAAVESGDVSYTCFQLKAREGKGGKKKKEERTRRVPPACPAPADNPSRCARAASTTIRSIVEGGNFRRGERKRGGEGEKKNDAPNVLIGSTYRGPDQGNFGQGAFLMVFEKGKRRKGRKKRQIDRKFSCTLWAVPTTF